MDARPQRRYVRLVEGHVSAAQAIASGVHSLPGGVTFAPTQAAWRFFRNPRVTLPAPVEPMQQVGRELAHTSASPDALVVHDWSKLDYDGHRSKKDLQQPTQARDVGYELATALEFTVREWCRLGRIRAEKGQSGRGAFPAWVIAHQELLRYQREGLLPFTRRPA